MPWSPSLALRYVGVLAADAAADAGEVARLRRATAEDVSHPALMRAFVRGACGFDLAHDAEEMALFYAVCLGDADVFGELVDRLHAMDQCRDVNGAVERWSESLAAFWARPDITELERIAESKAGKVGT